MFKHTKIPIFGIFVLTIPKIRDIIRVQTKKNGKTKRAQRIERACKIKSGIFIITLLRKIVNRENLSRWFVKSTKGGIEKRMELSDRQLVVLKLDEYGLTQKWLMLRLRRRKEEVTVSSLSDALSGRRNSERCKTIVRLSLEEIKNYQERMET